MGKQVVEFKNKDYIGFLYAIDISKDRDELCKLCNITKTVMWPKLGYLSRNDLAYSEDNTARLTGSGKIMLEKLSKDIPENELLEMAKHLFIGCDTNKQKKSVKKNEKTEETKSEVIEDNSDNTEYSGIKTTNSGVAHVTTKENDVDSTCRLPNNALGDRYLNRSPKPAVALETSSPYNMDNVFKDKEVKKRVDFLMELMSDNDPEDIKQDFRNLALKLLRRAMR